MDAKELTKAEEQLMQVLWNMQKAFVREIIDQMPNPKPPHSSVSTLMRILEAKGVVGYEAFGKSHRYYPLISREEYKKFQLKKLLGNYFDNSVHKLFSYFIQEQPIPEEDVQAIEKMIHQLKDKNVDR